MSKSFKNLIRMLVAALIYVMISAMGMSALAAAFDSDAKGSLTITPTYDGVVMDGGTFDIYRVADLTDIGSWQYTLLGEFVQSNVPINSTKTAQELEDAAKKLSACTSKVPSGEIRTLDRATDGNSVDGLEKGIYLVVQSGAPAGYTAAPPFLVYIPLTNDTGTGWDYDITASPKMELTPPDRTPTPTYKPTPTPKPTPEHDTAPQTGMLQWPIIVLAAVGLVLIAAGLLISRKKNKNG